MLFIVLFFYIFLLENCNHCDIPYKVYRLNSNHNFLNILIEKYHLFMLSSLVPF